jgi:DNA-binding MarR family transcriptional regulator
MGTSATSATYERDRRILTQKQQQRQQGIAYIIASHGALQQHSKREKCPVALLQTLLTIETMINITGGLAPRPSDVQHAMQISVSLLRKYLRELEERGYMERVRFYRRGALLLKPTSKGTGLLRQLNGNMQKAADKVLEWHLQ